MPVQTLPVDAPFRLGTVQVSLLPHHLPGSGPHCTLTIATVAQTEILSLGADDLRYLAARLILAAAHAEALTHRAERRVSRETLSTTPGGDLVHATP